MREDYLHYLWQFQKFDLQNMKTVDGQQVAVISPGLHNELSGPDFFNSRLLIGDQEWAGNVEIHIRSSDWYMHGHETDAAYDNVVLHVVWVHDVEIFRKDNSPLPVMEIQELVSPESLKSYKNLCTEGSTRWINCEQEWPDIEHFLINNWLERLYVERLEKRSYFISSLLLNTAGDWEAVLFQMLAKNFGLNINGEAFLSIAGSIPFSVVRKARTNAFEIEALFLGQAGLLNGTCEDPYFSKLKEAYSFLQHKYNLSGTGVLPVKYFRLRPDNFPELRLAQLAAIYHKSSSLFAELQKFEDPQQVYEVFNVQMNEFWSTHYTFSRSHAYRKKKLSRKFIDLIIINTVVPLKFTYHKSQGKDAFERIAPLIEAVAAEENEIIKKFRSLRPSIPAGALQSQALLQLKKDYCEKKACLNCAVGLQILQQQSQI
ncbi:DUF2851 family protein [Salinimicrobium terrae]|uniref:DUF2851 family protein n=1 Tax=Salinimicrobium terrae TaxID=470866 RepID=UPI0004235D5F|nr:DUF2851 family protein [Salinimicrobium terrae]